MSRLRASVAVAVVGAMVLLGQPATGMAPPPSGGTGSSSATEPTRTDGPSRKPTGSPPLTRREGGVADSALRDVTRLLEKGRTVSSSRAVVQGDRVRVEVVGRPRLVRSAVARAGGAVLTRFRTVTLADVPYRKLLAVERSPGVATVGLPGVGDRHADLPGADVSMALTGAGGSEVTQKTAVAAWHAAGYRGAGVKVGIVDYFDAEAWQKAQASGDLPAGPPTFCLSGNTPCDIWAKDDNHGVSVAEAVRDMAPDAQLYLATVGGATDLRAAVDWFASQGVRIVTRSLTAPANTPGDGTGIYDEIVDYAVGKGITFLNAAGNYSGVENDPAHLGGYYRFSWVDTDADGYMNFPDGTEYLAIKCGTAYSFQGIRWATDWYSPSKTDYDVRLVDQNGNELWRAETFQSSNPPFEGAGYPLGCGTGTGWVYLQVMLYEAGNGTANDQLEIFVYGAMEFYNNPGSASLPIVDSKSPGMLSVGAIDPWNGVTAATYSSWGPTNDGRLKPELSAPSNFSSVSGNNGRFNGTSAACPVVAGAAAVLLGATPSATPAQLVAALKGAVTDRGAPGADTIYGTGELTFPAPPAPPPPAAPGVSVIGTLVMPVVRTLKENFPVQVRWLTSGTQAQASVWRSVNGGEFTQGAVVGAEHRVRLKMALAKRNRFAVRAFDPAGTASEWAYTRTFRPRVLDDKDKKMKYAAGWRHFRQKGAWKGTLSSSAGTRGSMRVRIKGSAFSLAVFRSANSGKVRVYVDGKARARLNLRSNRVQQRRVVLNYVFVERGTHTIEIEPLTSGRDGMVFVDGILVLG